MISKPTFLAKVAVKIDELKIIARLKVAEWGEMIERIGSEPEDDAGTWKMKIGADRRGRRAILVGFRPQGFTLIYWGISLCKKGDKFDRDLGFALAKKRAMEAYRDKVLTTMDRNRALSITDDGLAGVVRLENHAELRQYFRERCRLIN